MRAFYSDASAGEPVLGHDGALGCPYLSRARVAVYEAPASAPRVMEIEPGPTARYLEDIASTVHRLAHEQGSDIPYTVIREVSENLIHAGFAEPVVSILDSGRTIRFADQGPGFADGARAMLPGFTTATEPMKQFIRGVGSGLPLVRDYLDVSGGTISIEDNLGAGAVITISSAPSKLRFSTHAGTPGFPSRAVSSMAAGDGEPGPMLPPLPFTESPRQEGPAHPLSTRQKQVLALVMEHGSAGPSLVSSELGVATSTAYRDLASLEERGLIVAYGGKRRLTPEGAAFLDGLVGR